MHYNKNGNKKPGYFGPDGYKVSARKQGYLQLPHLPKNHVKVTLEEDPSVGLLLRVKCFSTSHEGLAAENVVILKQMDGKNALEYAVKVAGGAVSEHLCEQYGDPLDPDYCAKVAWEMASDLLMQYGLQDLRAVSPVQRVDA